MVDETELIRRLNGLTPNWKILVRLESSAPAAAKLMHCSRRTALRALKEAAATLAHEAQLAKIATDVAIEQTRLDAAMASSWPASFSDLAARIEKEGHESVSAERRATVCSLPRGISVSHRR